MRRKLIIATTAGALALGGGLAVAVPALADGEASTTREDRIRDALTGLVDDGSLTGAQADEVAATLAESGLGGGHGHGHGGRLDLAAAATALDLTEDELREALATEGTSLADVAEQQGVAVDTLVEALVTAQQERLAQAVEAGDLTQEEADERLADLEERVAVRVADENGGPRGRGGSHRD
ncbi:hypothetical protein [Blastococcus sp. SYSU DS0533]